MGSRKRKNLKLSSFNLPEKKKMRKFIFIRKKHEEINL